MKENTQKWKTVTKSQSDGVPTFLWSSAMYLAHSVIWYVLQCIIQHWAVLLHLSTKFLSSCSFFEKKNLVAIWDKSSLHLLLQTFSFMNNTDCQRWYQDEESDSRDFCENPLLLLPSFVLYVEADNFLTCLRCFPSTCKGRRLQLKLKKVGFLI